MAEDEDLNCLNNFDREGLPSSGLESEIIEYYFYKSPLKLIADNLLRLDIMSKTRSSSKVEGEGCHVNLDQKIKAFMKSDDFRAILSTAINVTVEAAIKCFKNEFVELIDVRMKALEDTNTRLKRELTELHRKLGEVDTKANENEQYSRRNNLRFYGIIEKETEDCYDEVVKFCDRDLGVAIERNEIDRAHAPTR
ncbi:Hypothetical predicted protein, partial [Paramuricea clavata]